MPRLTSHRPHQPQRLEDLPNIGKAIAADLRRVGIQQPAQLAKLDPLETYGQLSQVMGQRQDPCVLYTLLSVQHFFETDEVRPWWHFTARGKELLHSKNNQRTKSGPPISDFKRSVCVFVWTVCCDGRYISNRYRPVTSLKFQSDLLPESDYKVRPSTQCPVHSLFVC